MQKRSFEDTGRKKKESSGRVENFMLTEQETKFCLRKNKVFFTHVYITSKSHQLYKKDFDYK